MKKLFLALLFVSSLGFSQEIKFDNELKIYNYTEIVETSTLTVDFVESKMISLGYTDIIKSESSVIGKNFFSVIIMGTPLQVFYNVEFELKDNRHRMSIKKFIIDDKRWSPVPLENIKSGKKKWISKINEELPKIISSFSKPDW